MDTVKGGYSPDEAGEFIFACGMNMVRGKLVVEPQAEWDHRLYR